MNKKSGRLGAMLSAVFAALLAIAMLPVNALAATTGSLTVTGVTAGATVNIYKIVSTTVDSATNAVTNTFVGDYGMTMEEYVALTSNSTEMKAAAAQIAAVATAGAATDTKTAEGTSVTFEGLDMGEYLVTVTPANDQGGVVYQNVIACIEAKAQDDNTIAAQDATVNVKTEPVTITKTAKQDNADLEIVSKYSKGDLVPYTVTVTVPTYPANAINQLFKVGDTMGTGLELDTATGVTVTNAAGGALTAGTDYTITASASGFEIVFDYSKVANLAGQSLTITYKGKVTADATPADPSTNTAKVEFANNPYDANSHDTKDDEVKVKTFGIYLLKTDNANTPLSGAEFTVYKDEACTQVVGTIVTGDDGYGRIEDLGEGTYYIKETKAPAGFVASTATITVNLTEAGTDQTEGVNYHFMNAGTVVNNPQPSLPVTGGAGTFALTGVGVALIAGAVAFTVRSRKDAKSER